jgi:hypothetical protein
MPSHAEGDEVYEYAPKRFRMLDPNDKTLSVTNVGQVTLRPINTQTAPRQTWNLLSRGSSGYVFYNVFDGCGWLTKNSNDQVITSLDPAAAIVWKIDPPPGADLVQ